MFMVIIQNIHQTSSFMSKDWLQGKFLLLSQYKCLIVVKGLPVHVSAMLHWVISYGATTVTTCSLCFTVIMMSQTRLGCSTTG